MSDELRKEWRCTGCGVLKYKPGCKMPAPKGWRTSDDTCLRCQRSDEDPADVARKALLDGYCVADAWRIAGGGKAGREGVPPKSAVRQWRAQYVEEDRLPRAEPAHRVDTPKPKAPKKRDELREKIEAELRADPDRPSSEIADALGCSYGRVNRARKALGLPKPKQTKKRPPRVDSKRAKAREALEAEPGRTSREIAEATGISVAVVRTARREAGIPAPEVDNRGRPVGA